MTVALPARLRTRAYINGNFVDATDGATFESLAPATGRAIATVAAARPSGRQPCCASRT
jgi:gamma-glutamyl-gamma-aminobutyraldehyde dehydrogenase